MKLNKLFFLTFILFLSFNSLTSQILPSYHGVFDKKENALTQTLMELPPHTTTPNTSWVRGYYFQAPTNFTISGLRVPTDASTECQNIAVVRFNSGPPPSYSGNNSTDYPDDFTQLYITICEEGDQIIDVNIPVLENQYIGIYGCRGNNCKTSYGISGNINFNGNNLLLQRTGMQYNLFQEGGMKDIFKVNIDEQGLKEIGRVELYFSN